MFEFRVAVSAAPADANSTFPEWTSKEPYLSLLSKWGLARAGEWSLEQYTFAHLSASSTAGSEPASTARHSKEATASVVDSEQQRHTAAPGAPPPSSSSSSSPPRAVTAASLRFHHGVAQDFLHALFASPAVKRQLSAAVEDDTSSLSYRALATQWTTLAPLREALVQGKVVRQSAPLSDFTADDGGDARRSVEGGEGEKGDVRLPTVKCAEELLPHGEVICDELRALFLQAHSRAWHHSASTLPTTQDCGNAPPGMDGEGDESFDEDEDRDMWGVMSGAKLPLRQLRSLFDPAARREFLYHVVWRLVAGSGPLNQFEDDAAVYLDVARQLYRSLITSMHVQESVVPAKGSAAVGEGVEERQQQEVMDDVTALEGPEDGSILPSSLRYTAVVDAFVFEVFAAPRLRLFATHDGVVPSNLNYCYVIVNPTEQTVNVWYHHC